MARASARDPSTDGSIGFLIYAQERMLRELVASVLAIRAGVHVAAQTGRVADVARACEDHAPDVLLVVASRPEDAAFEAAREFTERSDGGRVIVVGDPEQPFDVPDWLAGRIIAVIDRSEPLQRVFAVIDGLMPEARDGREHGLRGRLGGRALSQRESEVFALIGEGLTNAQIARRLALSDHTVRTHRKRIAAKLGTAGSELTRWAIVSRETRRSTVDDA
jgi:DNA-binding NarL/FixJ family response regulator